MKKLLLLSLILFLLSVAASAQLRNTDAFRRNVSIQRLRNAQIVSAEQYRLRIENLRLRMARERILDDGIITPHEKRKWRRIKKHPKSR